MFSEEAFSTVLEETVAFKTGGSCISAAAAAKSLQSFPTLCDPIDVSPPGSSVPGILQAFAQTNLGIFGDEKGLNFLRVLLVSTHIRHLPVFCSIS